MTSNSKLAAPSAANVPLSRVVIVGGGLAGMAAAVALESAGCSVTLLEARRALGGRATSFEDPQTGEVLDNCQHVLLGCCTNLLDFYRRLGVDHRIRYERSVHFVNERGQRFDLTGVRGLPAPLHLGPSMLRFGALSLSQRMAVSRDAGDDAPRQIRPLSAGRCIVRTMAARAPSAERIDRGVLRSDPDRLAQ